MRVMDIASVFEGRDPGGVPDVATLPSVRIGFTIFSECRRQQQGTALHLPGMDDEQ